MVEIMYRSQADNRVLIFFREELCIAVVCLVQFNRLFKIGTSSHCEVLAEARRRWGDTVISSSYG